MPLIYATSGKTSTALTPGTPTCAHCQPSRRMGRCARLRGLGVGLCRAIAWGPDEAATQEIKTRAPKHLAFEHFETIDMPLDRAGRPGQSHACFDRLVILIQPFRKALQGLQRTGRRALQPGVKRFRWLLADQGRKVLRQVDRLGDLGLLRAQLGELLCLSLGALRLASEDEPCRPARRQRLARRLGYR